MFKTKKRYPKFVYFLANWITPLLNPARIFSTIPGYFGFLRDWARYSKLKGAERINLLDTYPCVQDKTQTTQLDKHYFYQDTWAAQRVYENKPLRHMDLASRAIFAGLLASFTKVSFVDIRPLEVKLDNFESLKGDILSLPFEDNSLESLSCLSVAEHIGLGRYGDKLNPQGTKEACLEMARVISPGGNLYFAVPVGKPRLIFNGMRIHSPEQIIEYFKGLELVELSGVDDNGNFIRNIDIKILSGSDYACGLFWFKKSN